MLWEWYSLLGDIHERPMNELQKRNEEERRKEAREARIKSDCLNEARQEIQEIHNRLTAKKKEGYDDYDEYVKECDKLRRKYPSVGFNIHCSNFSGWGFNSSFYRIEIISYRGKSIY